MLLDNLPIELLVKTAQKMSVTDAIALSQTSKYFRDILNNPENGVWQHYFKRDFPNARCPTDNTKYKDFYLKQVMLKILEKIKNLSAAIDFIQDPAHGLSNTSVLTNIKTKINAITSETTISELSALYKEACLAVPANNIVSARGNTPLICAVLHGHTDIAAALIKAGANVNHADKYGDTALIMTARHGHTDIALALIKAGANVNHATQYGTTALISATDWGRTDIVIALIKAGANINHVNNAGETALSLATSEDEDEDRFDIVTILKQAAAFNTVKPLLLSRAAGSTNEPLDLENRHARFTIL